MPRSQAATQCLQADWQIATWQNVDNCRLLPPGWATSRVQGFALGLEGLGFQSLGSLSLGL